MSEPTDEQKPQPVPEPARKRVITVRARGVEPVGPDEISREQFEDLGADKQRVIEFVRRRDAEQEAAA